MANLDQMSLFDMFEDFGASPVEEKTEEPNKKANASNVTPSPVDEAEDDGADDAAEETASTTEEVKPAAPKTVSKSKSVKKIPGPVKVVGTGWEYQYGEVGASYEPKEVLKALFNEGFKEIACASASMPKGGNVIYVNAVGGHSSSDTLAVNDVTVILARKASVFKAEDFPGLDADEISLYDVTEKFVEACPEFKGCALNYSAGIAVPTFETTYKLNKDSSNIIKVWREDGIREYNESEAALLFDEDCVLYKSDADVYFPAYSAKGKGSQNIYLGLSDLGLKNTDTKDVEEKYHLPATLYLETFGQRKELKAEDFDGKEKITKKELLDWLKPQYKVFQSSNRKFDVIYEKAQALVSVAIISGEKGAADSAASEETEEYERIKRIEITDVGVFKGDMENGEVTRLDFTLSLPKIPVRFLYMLFEDFREDYNKEKMLQIYWDKEKENYFIARPEQMVTKTSVSYRMKHTAPSEVLVLSVHSHNTMAPEWSATDNADEIYTGLFGVIGHIDRAIPDMRFRAGMEGTFMELSPEDLFDTAA